MMNFIKKKTGGFEVKKIFLKESTKENLNKLKKKTLQTTEKQCKILNTKKKPSKAKTLKSPLGLTMSICQNTETIQLSQQ